MQCLKGRHIAITTGSGGHFLLWSYIARAWSIKLPDTRHQQMHEFVVPLYYLASMMNHHGVKAWRPPSMAPSWHQPSPPGMIPSHYSKPWCSAGLLVREGIVHCTLHIWHACAPGPCSTTTTLHHSLSHIRERQGFKCGFILCVSEWIVPRKW